MIKSIYILFKVKLKIRCFKYTCKNLLHIDSLIVEFQAVFH